MISYRWFHPETLRLPFIDDLRPGALLPRPHRQRFALRFACGQYISDLYGAVEFTSPFDLQAANTLSDIALGQVEVVVATREVTPTMPPPLYLLVCTDTSSACKRSWEREHLLSPNGSSWSQFNGP